MQKKFIKKTTREIFLKDTPIENIFIGEYMPSAPAEYVKVYIFGLMYAEYDSFFSNEEIAKHLRIEVEDVLKAWNYWEKMGVIKKSNVNKENKMDYTVEFIEQKAIIYGKGQEETSLPELNMEDDDLKEIYESIEKITGRLLSGNEPFTVMSWIEEFGASKEVIICAYEYCKNEKSNSNLSYVGQVVKNWALKGMKTKKEVTAYLEEMSEKHYRYKRILQFLGFHRSPTEKEKKIIDRWFDDFNFSMDKVLDACSKTSGISNPNINYVNKILENWYKEAGGTLEVSAKKKEVKVTQRDVEKYYSEIRLKNEEIAAEKKQAVYAEIPEIRHIDEEIRNIGINLSKLMLKGGKSKVDSIKTKIEDLNEKKKALLLENDYEADYMEVEYLCPNCNDTGINDEGNRCKCFEKRFEELNNE